eukprot:scaffold3703_cov141-Pinguiococcus_pyrenoidosus.AAC.1
MKAPPVSFTSWSPRRRSKRGYWGGAGAEAAASFETGVSITWGVAAAAFFIGGVRDAWLLPFWPPKPERPSMLAC